MFQKGRTFGNVILAAVNYTGYLHFLHYNKLINVSKYLKCTLVINISHAKSSIYKNMRKNFPKDMRKII